MKKILFFLLIPVFWCGYSLNLAAQDVEGSWSGAASVQGMKLPLILNIAKGGEEYKATMDSPHQGAKGIPVSSIEFNNPVLTVSIDVIGFKYTGRLDGDSISGSFTQSGVSFPLNLGRQIAEVVVNRPQNPLPPFPYNEKEVVFENKEAGIKLAGTFTYPLSGSQFPAVVLVTGSGPQNRDEEILGHKPFLVLADYLTRQGIAVLRYDDRGVGKSEGDFKTATTADFASDALAAFHYLKGEGAVGKAGLVGHSEGGTIALMLAAESSEIDFVVSMAGSAVKGRDILRRQRLDIGTQSGVPQANIDTNERLVEKTEAIVLQYPMDSIESNIAYFAEILQPGASADKNLQQTLLWHIKQMGSPWMRYFVDLDPSESLGKIKCPVLAINGGKDLQVNAAMNLSEIEKLVKSDKTLKEYPNLNHLFQNCTTGLPAEYAAIEETIAVEVLNDMGNWILQVGK